MDRKPREPSTTEEQPRDIDAEAAFVEFLRRREEEPSLSLDAFCAERPAVAGLLLDMGEVWGGLEDLAAERQESPPLRERPSTGARRYVVRREIARGGMGSILEVFDEELRRSLAMKVLQDVGDGGFRRARRESRMLNEAQVLGQLEHPGIVPVHEVGRSDAGELYFTMPLVRGRDLAEVARLVREERLGWTLVGAITVLRRVCDAVAYAHSMGVVHRDLKPANVMVGAFGVGDRWRGRGSVAVLSGKDGTVLWLQDGGGARGGFGVDVAAAGDVDADGVPDLAVLVSSLNGVTANRVEVLDGRGGQPLRSVEIGERRPYDLRSAGDLDGDGAHEWLLDHGAHGVLSIAAGFLDVGGGRPVAWHAPLGDGNGDGVAELVLGFVDEDGGRTIEVFSRGLAEHHADVPESEPPWRKPRAVTGDVDGDGLWDLALVDRVGTASTSMESELRILFGAHMR